MLMRILMVQRQCGGIAITCRDNHGNRHRCVHYRDRSIPSSLSFAIVGCFKTRPCQTRLQLPSDCPDILIRLAFHLFARIPLLYIYIDNSNNNIYILPAGPGSSRCRLSLSCRSFWSQSPIASNRLFPKILYLYMRTIQVHMHIFQFAFCKRFVSSSNQHGH